MTVLTLALAAGWQTAAPHFIAPGMDYARALELLREAAEPPVRRHCVELPRFLDGYRFEQYPRTGVTLRIDHVATGYKVREVRWESPRPGFALQQPPVVVPPELK